MPEEPQNSDQTNEYVEPSTGPDTSIQPLSGSQSSQTSESTPFYNFEASATPVAAPVTPSETPVVSDASEPMSPVPQKSKKPLIIGIIIAAILIVLLGGGSLVYGLWYQNPDKVVSDALMNAITAKSSTYVGTMNINNSDTKTAISLTAKQTGKTGSIDTTVSTTASGKTYSLDGSALVDSTGDMYVKVDKLAALVADFKDQINVFVDATQSSAIDQLVTKIDGNWVKVSTADLKGVSGATATAKTCASDALNQFQSDKAAMSEVTDLYKKHPFITIGKNLGVKDGSNGYVITNNQAAFKDFLESLKTTKIYATLHGCDSTFTINTASITTAAASDTQNSTVELWVSSWSHQITKLNFNDTASDGTTTTMTITPTYNQPVQITAPQSSTTISQLQSDITAIMTGF